jgi:hypothetical protein
MAKFEGTVARVGKGGVMEHKHGTFGWHWACAGHRDNGEIHAAAKAATPTFEEGVKVTPELIKRYTEAFTRVVVTKIPSKAKAKVTA